MRNFFFLLAITLCFTHIATPARADDEEGKKNCKITVRKKMKSGKTKLEILQVAAASREDCKLQAEDKKKTDDEDIASVQTTFGFTR